MDNENFSRYTDCKSKMNELIQQLVSQRYQLEKEIEEVGLRTKAQIEYLQEESAKEIESKIYAFNQKADKTIEEIKSLSVLCLMI